MAGYRSLLLTLSLVQLQAAQVFSQTLPMITQDPLGQIATVGSDVTLNCTATPAGSSIQWTKDGAVITSNERYNATGNQLHITGFSSSTEGSFTCLATIGELTVTSAIASLRLPVLSFASGSTTIAVDHGGSVTVSCGQLTARPLSLLSYDWKQVFGNHEGSLTMNSPVEGANGDLHIRNAVESATYRCRAIVGTLLPPAHFDVSLTINSATAAPPTSPVLVAPSDVNTVQGGRAEFECIVVAEAVISWTYPPGVIHVTPDPAGRLSVFQVTSAYEGTYSCNVTSDGVSTVHSAMLTVTVPPVITSSSFAPASTVNYGTPISLTCTASGRTISWRWYHNATQMPTSSSTPSTSTIVITSAMRENAGAYQCFAYNPAGHSSSATALTVQVVPPTITTGLTNKVAFTGQSFTFTCAASGAPPPTFTWKKDNIPLDQAIFGGADGRLTLPMVQSAMVSGGEYECTASSFIGGEEVGSAKSVATLFVTGAPTIVSAIPSQLEVFRGQAITLNCTANHSSDTTITLTWSKDGQELSSGGNITLTPISASLSASMILNITKTTPSDAGMYTCTVTTTFMRDGNMIPTPPTSPRSSNIVITESPVAPTVTAVDVINSTTLRVSWLYNGLISNLDSFRVEYRINSGDWTIGVVLNPRSTTQVFLSSLHPYSSYSVRVTAVSRDQSVVDSSESRVRTPEDAPFGTPLRIAVATQRDNTTLHVQWQPPLVEDRNGIITDYTIQYKINRTNNLLTVSVGSNSTLFTLTRLVPGQRYAVQIAAHTAAGMGPFSDVHYADTIIRAPIQVQPQFYQSVWFIFLCVMVVVIAVLLLGCVVLVVKWKKRRKIAKYTVRDSFHGVDNVSLSEDTVADYENRKKDQLQTAFMDELDGVDSEVSMPTAATISTHAPSHSSLRIAGISPPGYIEPPSFEETLRARSASLSALEKHMTIQGRDYPQQGLASSSHSYIPRADPNSEDEKHSVDSGHHSHTRQPTLDFATFV